MKIVLGCMGFGNRVNNEQSKEMVIDFLEKNQELDTAVLYGDGLSESILGQINSLIKSKNGKISTKINPSNDGFLPENFKKLFEASLTRLNVDSVDVLYLHWPCHDYPIEPILEQVHKLYEQGKFARLGLSNYSSWQVAKICQFCENRGFVKPSVYQGLYNCLTRGVENELIPCLRAYNISFYAYNPLARGILTGKYQFEDMQKILNTNAGHTYGVGGYYQGAYQQKFWNTKFFNAIENIKTTLSSGKTLTQISFDWLVNHSLLDDKHGDAIICGASSLEQYHQNVSCIKNSTKISEETLNAIDSSYFEISSSCPNYFR